MIKQKNIGNALLFNVAWLCCVLGGDIVAVSSAAAVLFVHVRYIGGDWREILLILQILVLGFFVDSILMRSDVLLAPASVSMPPIWLMCLWVIFATTLNHSMRWFHSHFVIAMLLGGCMVPLSYYAGTRFTDFSLADPVFVSMAIIGSVWALVFPLCLWLAQRFEERFHIGEVAANV